MEHDNLTQQNKRIIWTWSPVVFLAVLFCCTLWGSATPLIKIAYQLFQITPDNTASRILLAGTRFIIAGILTIGFGSLIQRRFVLPKRSSLKDIGILALFQTVGQGYLLQLLRKGENERQMRQLETTKNEIEKAWGISLE